MRAQGGIAIAVVALAAFSAAGPIGPDSSKGGGNPPRVGDGRGGVVLDSVARFDKPTFLGAPPGGRNHAVVVEREGVIKLLQGDKKLKGAFLNIRGLVRCCSVETGLHSIAFAPDYERSRRFYVYFTNREGNIEIDEFKRSRRSELRADRDSRRKLIEIRQRQPAHNGGQVAIGPDGLLYAATGDGGTDDDPSRLSQRKGDLHGKLLRIDPTPAGKRPYGIPNSNPYEGKKGANEIYARGLRNPWRFSFDRDRILIADVGQGRREEINMERIRGARGANFGWDAYEGTLRFRGGPISHHDKPIHQVPHSTGSCSIDGGYVVRDERLRSLYGRYVYSDYCSGEIRSLIPTARGSRDDKRLDVAAKPGTVSFGVDDRERVYVAVITTGKVYRLDPK
jgi:Glucose / Sorbosone dehydrogenase